MARVHPIAKARPLALLLLSLFLALPSLAFDYSKYVGKTTVAGNAAIVPNRWIVEFNSSAAVTALGSRKRGDVSIHAHVYRQLQARNIPYTVMQTYDSPLFVGASLQMADSNIAQLAALPGVTNIMPVHFIQRPTTDFASDWSNLAPSNATGFWKRIEQALNNKRENRGKDNEKNKHKHTTTASSPAASTSVVSSAASNSVSATSSAAVSTTASSSASASASASSTASNIPTVPSVIPYSSLVKAQIGVDTVNAGGNYGAGVKIAIVDSGVDYTLPSLGGCFGAGCKIAGGYDYVGNTFDGSNTPMPSNDPLDQCYGHGTFVAGIIGADTPNTYNVSGVAPQATQYHYRIFSCYGSTTDDIVAKAMQDAFTNGADIINLSLGEISSWTESMLSVVASRIQDQGVPVVASIGNEGLDGDFYVESPATGANAIGVGSVDSVVLPAQQAVIDAGAKRPITYYSLDPLASSDTFPLVALSTSYPNNNDACTPPTTSLDLANSVLVVQTSTNPACSMMNQARALYQAGAKRVLAIAQPGTLPAYAGGFPFAYAQINSTDGQYLLNLIATEQNPTITFGFYPIAVPNTFTGGLRSPISAIGPTNDLYLKPQLMAPGAFIVSTLPTAVKPSGFAGSSGTSFSNPFVTGAIALYFTANGGRANAGNYLQAFEGTAHTVPNSLSDSSPISAAEEGAGLINANDALQTSLIINPSQILLNDTANIQAFQYLTIQNTAQSWSTLTLTHVPANTIYSLNAGTYESSYDPLDETAGTTSVAIFPNTVFLPPGGEGVVGLYFTPPRGLDSSRFPVYSGFVQVQGGSVTQRIPYLGVAAAMRNLPILDNSTLQTGSALPDLVNGQGNVQSGPETYTLANGDAPTVMYRLWGGTRALLIDLVDANASLGFNPTITNSRRDGLGSILGDIFNGVNGFLNGQWKYGFGGYPGTFQKVPTLGNVYVANYIPRNSGSNPAYDDGNELYSYAFSGTFTNGTTVPNGSYRFLVRALRITGNPNQESNYDSWVSPVVTIAA